MASPAFVNLKFLNVSATRLTVASTAPFVNFLGSQFPEGRAKLVIELRLQNIRKMPKAKTGCP